jgi:UDP-N-acetylglucosamine 4-epimerase
MSKILVTGCGGFIGSNLSSHLLDLGHTVVGLDNFSTGFRENIATLTQHNSFHLIEGDIRHLDTCHQACNGVDFVSHQAALGSVPRSITDPLLYNDNNITGTLNMLIAARDAGVKRFVYASSSSVYGDTPVLPKVETMIPRPKSPYAISKIAAEYYAKVFNDAYGLQTIGLRYFNVFGPQQDPRSQYAAVIPKFITSFLANTSPVIYGTGEQTRDFTYIANVITANINSFFAPETSCGLAYNIGCGDRISLNQLAAEIKSITNSIANPIHEAPRVGDVKDSLADITLSTQNLNLSNRIMLRTGLEHTINWYQNNR